jgi:hypothetical protein
MKTGVISRIVRIIDKAIIILSLAGSFLLGIALFYNLAMIVNMIFFIAGLTVSCATVRMWFTSKLATNDELKQ